MYAHTCEYCGDTGIIIFDHLISESNEPQKKYTLIPDGDYEGFEWKNGQWLHIDKVLDFKLKDGEAPVPEALDDNKQKVNKTSPPKKTATPVKKKPGGGEINVILEENFEIKLIKSCSFNISNFSHNICFQCPNLMNLSRGFNLQ